jgi:hypothetical protein
MTTICLGDRILEMRVEANSGPVRGVKAEEDGRLY